MSGGSGGSGGGGDSPRPTPKPVKPKKPSGGGGGGDPNPCDIDNVTTLNSPNPAVLKTLKKGDILDVVLVTAPRRGLQAKKAADTAGSITFPQMGQVMACIDAGEIYHAEVISISGGQCQLRVYLG